MKPLAILLGGMAVAFAGIMLIASQPGVQDDLTPFFLVMGWAMTCAARRWRWRASGL